MTSTTRLLVGRDAELRVLGRALEVVEEGTSHALGIVGEPGIGKSRLLGELGSRAAERGHVVVAGRAAELERDVPFALWLDALDGHVGGYGTAALAAVERHRVARGVHSLLTRMADTSPVTLLLDDVHWADPAEGSRSVVIQDANLPITMDRVRHCMPADAYTVVCSAAVRHLEHLHGAGAQRRHRRRDHRGDAGVPAQAGDRGRPASPGCLPPSRHDRPVARYCGAGARARRRARLDQPPGALPPRRRADPGGSGSRSWRTSAISRSRRYRSSGMPSWTASGARWGPRAARATADSRVRVGP